MLKYRLWLFPAKISLNSSEVHSSSLLPIFPVVEIQYFSYPFGGKYDYNKETIGILKEEGFQRAYTAREQQGEDIMYEIPRIIVPNLGKGEFECKFFLTPYIPQSYPQGFAPRIYMKTLVIPC